MVERVAPRGPEYARGIQLRLQDARQWLNDHTIQRQCAGAGRPLHRVRTGTAAHGALRPCGDGGQRCESGSRAHGGRPSFVIKCYLAGLRQPALEYRRGRRGDGVHSIPRCTAGQDLPPSGIARRLSLLSPECRRSCIKGLHQGRHSRRSRLKLDVVEHGRHLVRARNIPGLRCELRRPAQRLSAGGHMHT